MITLTLFKKLVKIFTLSITVFIHTLSVFASENINIFDNDKILLLQGPINITSILPDSLKCNHNMNYVRAYIQDNNGLLSEFIECLDCGYDSRKDKR